MHGTEKWARRAKNQLQGKRIQHAMPGAPADAPASASQRSVVGRAEATNFLCATLFSTFHHLWALLCQSDTFAYLGPPLWQIRAQSLPVLQIFHRYKNDRPVLLFNASFLLTSPLRLLAEQSCIVVTTYQETLSETVSGRPRTADTPLNVIHHHYRNLLVT